MSYLIFLGYWCDVTIVTMLVPIERLLLLSDSVTYYIRRDSVIYTGHLILLFSEIKIVTNGWGNKNVHRILVEKVAA